MLVSLLFPGTIVSSSLPSSSNRAIVRSWWPNRSIEAPLLPKSRNMSASSRSSHSAAAASPKPNTSCDSSSLSPLQDLPADSLLVVLLHLNVIDLSRTSLTSKRLLYLTYTAQTKIVGTECSALSEKAAALQANKEARKLKTYRGGERTGNYRPADVVRRALTRLRCPPTIAFMFHTSRGGGRSSQQAWYQESPSAAEKLLPPSCAILSASSQDIQANCGGLVESESGVGVLLASFDRTKTSYVPFVIASGTDESDDEGDDDGNSNENDNDEVQQLLNRLEEAKPSTAESGTSPNYWKVIFVYVCGNSHLDPDVVLGRVQAAHPDCIIVGGVCEAGHVRLFAGQRGREEKEEGGGKPSTEEKAATKQMLCQKTTRQLRSIISQLVGDGDAGGGEGKEFLLPNLDTPKKELINMAISMGFTQTKSAHSGDGTDLTHVPSGIFGVAIGGDVPVRAVVSRGARSLTTQEIFPQSSPWTVTNASIIRPGELGHPFYRGDPDGGNVSFHVINRVKSSETGEELDGVNFILSHRAEFVGLRRTNAAGDGFDLTTLEMHNVGTGRLMIADVGSSSDSAQIANHVGSQIDIFKLDGPACIQDVGLKLDRLKELVSAQCLLAGLMFSCNGRGPDATYLINQEMCDAQSWNERFSSVPMLGFYAGGEIGPRALAGNINIFQSGQAALQGFTAVFVLFIVPKVEIGSFSLDDGPESIALFMRQRMSNTCSR